VLTKEFAGRGHSDLLFGPVEQFDPQFLFQLAHRCRERGLHNVHSRSGAREVHLAGDGDEVLELAKFHSPTLSIL
jgi:hypothetical protein